ncbi:MAG: PHP domain-containing protein [Clostridia bacterium]|nr:PHP domain-containing protein [Clostridia bacterium]
MLADLHVHTWFSDSTRSPAEVARAAKAQGIGILAVCDHNTIAGHGSMAAACTEVGIGFVPGVEINASYEGRDQHILAFGCDFAHPALGSLLAENQRILEQVSIDLIDRMRTVDPQLDLAEYAAYERDSSRGGWKGIDYLRFKGYKIAYPACMEYYARYDCRPAGFPPVEKITAAVHTAGGLAILAHPGEMLPKDELNTHLFRLAGLGIDGMECYYPAHSAAVLRTCLNFCHAHGLCITAGSDDHGGFTEWVGGVHYAMGALRVDTGALRLGGLL